jgi:mono/diheme cytochrome c family protein
MKIVTAVAAFVICAAAPAAFAQSHGNAKKGKDAYMAHCATCHAADGNGKESAAELMKVKFPPLGGEKAQSLSDAQMAQLIEHGKNKMKPVKDVSKKDIANIIAFVRTFKK